MTNSSTLRWFRSWPATIDLAELGNKGPLPPHVEDHLPRLVMSRYDYQTVVEWPDDEPGFCLLEWDIALDPWGMRAFAAEAMVEPHRLLVAPYRFHDQWDCWHNPADAINGQGFGPDPAGRPIKAGDEYTDSHGLGCIFLPRHAVVDFLAQMDRFGFTDATFGGWYRQRWGPARVTWRVHPQHLHDY